MVKTARYAAGFTLVEVMVVLVIVALMLALVGSSISRNISGAEMRTAAGKVAAGLRYTRTQAILKKSEQVFLVDTENLTYQAGDRKADNFPKGMLVELNTARSELTSESAGGIRFYPGWRINRRECEARGKRSGLPGQRCLADRRSIIGKGGGMTG